MSSSCARGPAKRVTLSSRVLAKRAAGRSRCVSRRFLQLRGLPVPVDYKSLLRNPQRGLWRWVGFACTGAGPFYVRQEDAAGTSSAGWSQRSRSGHQARTVTRPKEVTSAPNPVSTTASASPKCGSSARTASRSGSSPLNDALRLAQEADLDLVEVAPTARPPVCKLMDYGKFKYESALKASESRKNQAQTVIKEIKLRPKIDPHDYGTKKGHVERFLKQGDKVKVTIMFRGREQSRPELGFRLLQRLAGDVEELGFVESQPKQDGRNMIMVIGPHRKKSESKAERARPGTSRLRHRGRCPGRAARRPPPGGRRPAAGSSQR